MATESRRPADAGGGALDTGPGERERVEHDPSERVPKPPAPGDRELIEEAPSTAGRPPAEHQAVVGERQPAQPAASASRLGRLPLIGRFFR